MRQVYIDYGFGSPVDARVIEGMMPYFDKDVGNPSSLHSPAGKPNANLKPRTKVAAIVATPNLKSIIFTSCATESNNLALRGATLR